MKRLRKILFSMETAVALLMVCAIAVAAATFIENARGTDTARHLIYNARWFEILLIWLTVNLVGNLFHSRMWKQGKYPAFLFHIAFLVIVLGAGVTRYKGHEGLMHIREGGESNTLLSSRSYLQATVTDGIRQSALDQKITPSRAQFAKTLKLNESDLTLRCVEYLENARPVPVDEATGGPVASLMVSSGEQPEQIVLELSDSIVLDGYSVAFGTEISDTLPAIRLDMTDGALTVTSTEALTKTTMRSQKRTDIPPGQSETLEPMAIYTSDRFQFALQRFLPKGRIDAAPVQHQQGRHPGAQARGFEAVRLEIETEDALRHLTLFQHDAPQGKSHTVKVDDLTATLTFGPKVTPLPFSLKLTDFQIERYPGSRMPASYASEVILIDAEKNLERPYRIYMNHILKHRGYRFFQQFFDGDEQGTILSVSHDPGTPITYAGYALLMIALVVNLFHPRSRFRTLARKLSRLTITPLALFCVVGLGTLLTSALPVHAQTEQLTTLRKVDQNHARRFGALIVQDDLGRMKPVNSLAHEILSNIAGTRNLADLHPDQILLGILIRPDLWKTIPLIRVDDPAIRLMLGLGSRRTLVSLQEAAYPGASVFRLAREVQAVKAKNPAKRTRSDKALIRLQERFDLTNELLEGRLLRLFPVPGDRNHTWAFVHDNRIIADSVAVGLLTNYIASVNQSLISGSWDAADRALATIAAYQASLGAEVMPSQTQREAEILYNETQIFYRLTPLFLWGGLALLLAALARLAFTRRLLDACIRAVIVILAIGFMLHTAGFILRWIAAGHAPWSNKYESMVYIAWAAVMAGFLFVRHTPLALALGSLFSGLLLTVAHNPGVDSQLTNLVPVLKSHWLVIHVSVVTSSYGFLALGACLGLLSLLLFIGKTDKNRRPLDNAILRLACINERSLLVGLTLMTIGNFFGAIWANESWGRYWGWDPKEAWSFIIILVYAVVTHLRIIPRLRSPFTFSVASVLAFSTVIMTYFGVNLYLSGLHAYAGGDAATMPAYVFISGVILLIIIGLAFRNRQMDSQIQTAMESETA